MKQILLIALLVFLVIFPVQAQSIEKETYEFGTGTGIDYPADWETELIEGILSISDDTQSQALVLDYPVIYSLSDDGVNISSINAIEIVTDLLLDITVDHRDIYEFKFGVRNILAYDVRAGIPASIFAVEFSNGAMGVLATINVDEDTENDMLRSFDNSEEVIFNRGQSIIRNPAERDVPTILVFGNEQRVVIPPGWTVDARQKDGIQYLQLALQDNDIIVQLFDLSEVVTSGTELDEVLDSIEIDWETDFELEIIPGASDYYFGDREAISYELISIDSEGILIILRHSDDAIGLVTVSGTTLDEYTMDINQIIGSFNNLDASARLIR